MAKPSKGLDACDFVREVAGRGEDLGFYANVFIETVPGTYHWVKAVRLDGDGDLIIEATGGWSA